MISESKLDFWTNNNLNVLFRGRHGVGKTSMIIETWKRNEIKYKYFSASTMDPWVDFIGVPRAEKDEKGEYLDFILPKDLRDNEIEAIFFDELNRAHKKVLNAVMELIQFKSINGRKFPNLCMIWGACNPINDEEISYTVEELDPALEDRFQVQVDIPYKLHKPYFTKKFGQEWSNASYTWWNQLEDNQKLQVSPRRLETALDIYKIEGGDIRDVLPKGINIGKLINNLTYGDPIYNMKILIKNKEKNKLKKFLEIENNFSSVKSTIGRNDQIIEATIPLIDQEKVASLMTEYKQVENYILSPKKLNNHIELIKEIAHSNSSNSISYKCKKIIKSINIKNTSDLYIFFPNSIKKKININTYKNKFQINPQIEDIANNSSVTSNQTYKQIINKYSNQTKGTISRKKLLLDLYLITNNNAKKEEIELTLFILNYLISKFHNATCLSMHEYIVKLSIICIKKTLSNNKSNNRFEIAWQSLIKNYPFLIKFLCIYYSSRNPLTSTDNITKIIQYKI